MAIVNIAGTLPLTEDIRNTIPIGVSPLGTPVYDNITLIYNDALGNRNILQLQSVQFSVTQEQTIVENAVSGRNGTIKEYVSENDYNVSINAFVNELFNVFPFDQLRAWRKIKEAGESIQVINKTLNNVYEIDTFVVTRFQDTPTVASLNQHQLSIELKSDFPFDPNEFDVTNIV